MAKTEIEWATDVWNPTTGCDLVTRGCDNCYAKTMARRLKAMELSRVARGKLDPADAKYQTDGDPRTSGPGFGIAMHERVLTEPFSWKPGRKVFVNSMSDLFHKGVTDEFIARVFAVMAATPQHTYQVLTKRHARLRSLLLGAKINGFHDIMAAEAMRLGRRGLVEWPLPNVWLGVSVEDQKRADLRIPALLDTPAAIRFLSCEPLLGPVDLSTWIKTVGWPPCWDTHRPGAECGRCIMPDWVIVGGESGPGARPAHPDWFRSIRDQCAAEDVAFHFKQRGVWTWDQDGGDHSEPDLYVNAVTGETADEESALAAGGDWIGVWRVGKKRAGRELDRQTHDEFPVRAA